VRSRALLLALLLGACERYDAARDMALKDNLANY